MDNFTIHCTESQTKKAFELGAPLNAPFVISTNDEKNKENHIIHCTKGNPIIRSGHRIIPTAEQLIGWLEETYDLHIIIDYRRDYADDADGNIVDEWYYYCFFLSISDKCFYGEDTLDEYTSRKEATLAAIDAALEYLNNKK